MEKKKYYHGTRFSAIVLAEAHDSFLSQVTDVRPVSYRLVVTTGNETWRLDTVQEYLAEHDKGSFSYFCGHAESGELEVFHYEEGNASVAVSLPRRDQIQNVFQVFDRSAPSSKLAVESDPVKVFIGHGHDPQWRDLKDHLHELHGLDVTAYEIGPRAGLSVKEVLQEMLTTSSFALLVLTGEDQHADGELHARENVIHELGLFQGRLGFTRAVVLLEEGVSEFSNILGVNQIRFPNGRIRETYGDVLATIKREFEKQAD